jgi:hypothetical protein
VAVNWPGKPRHNVGQAERIESTPRSSSANSIFIYIGFPRSKSYTIESSDDDGTESSRDFQASSQNGKGRINKKDT